MSRRTSSAKELPPCPGPKLHIFPHHKLPIQWIERLDCDRDEDSIGEGYVFRAKIGSREYAVKVFKFYDPLDSEYFWGPVMGEDTSLKTASYYTDPFFAECRAYGRIKESIKSRKLKPQVAATCHGYLFLSQKDEEILENFGVDLGLDDVDIDFQQNAEGGCRPRAIVKDLVLGDAGVDRRSARRILRGIKALNKVKIYNQDIRLDNFKDGQIVDFGSSWTEPHGLLDALHERAVQSTKIRDLVRFDEMVRNEEIETDVRAMRNTQYCKKLRSR